MDSLVKGHIIFDHDGTLVQVNPSGLVVFKEMTQLLRELKNLGFEIHIWTARPRRSTLFSLKENDLEQFFTNIYCSDDGIVKPHPMGLEKITDGALKNSVIHIGDSYSDYEGAKNFGIDFIAACWDEPDNAKEFKKWTNNVAISISECRNLIYKKYNL